MFVNWLNNVVKLYQIWIKNINKYIFSNFKNQIFIVYELLCDFIYYREYVINLYLLVYLYMKLYLYFYKRQ